MHSQTSSQPMTLVPTLESASKGSHTDILVVLLLMQSVLIVSLGVSAGWIALEGSALSQLTAAAAAVCVGTTVWLVRQAIFKPYRAAVRTASTSGPRLPEIESWRQLVSRRLSPDTLRDQICCIAAIEIDRLSDLSRTGGARGDEGVLHAIRRLGRHQDDAIIPTGDGEFRVLWTDCDAEQARRRCLELRASLSASDRPGEVPQAAISMGVLEIPSISNRSAEDFLLRLDERLRSARSAGDNSIFVGWARDNLIQFPGTSAARRTARGTQQGIVR